MSLINDALKKAEQETGGDDGLENAYPQKVLFVAGRQGSHRLLITITGVLVLGALGVMALRMPSLTQRLLRIGGVAPAAKPRQLVAPSQAQPAKPAVADGATKAQA